MKVVNILKKINSYGGIETMLDGFLSSAKKNVDVNVDTFIYGKIVDHPRVKKMIVNHDLKIFPGIFGLVKIGSKVLNLKNVDVVLVHQPLTLLFFGFIKTIFFRKWKLIYFIHINIDNIKIPKQFLKPIFFTFGLFTYRILSESQDNLIKLSDYFKESQLGLIYPPILDDNLEPDSTIEKKYDFLFVGRLTDQKNPKLFIDSFREASRYKQNIRGAIVGTGDLEQEVSLHASGLNIDILGSIGDEELHKIFLQSEVFVMTSRYEGFGFVLVEALAYDLKVVSTDCPVGPREILSNSRGILCKEDHNEIAKQMLYSLKSNNKKETKEFVKLFKSSNATESIIRSFK